MNCQQIFSKAPIVPVVTIHDARDALPMAEALVSAGVRAVEITLRTDAALASIQKIASEIEEIRVGAGSIRKVGQFRQALDAGAEFCVSPGFSVGLLNEAEKLNANFIPGSSTAAEVLQLYEQGYEFVKFFPAELSGGVSMLKALSAPLAEMAFFPTGGISASLAHDYLSLASVICIGGSWFVPADKIREGDFQWIRAEAESALRAFRD